MQYILGIVAIFIQKSVLSIANILDNQLSRKTFKSVWALVALNGIVAIPIIPLLYLILRPNFITLHQLFIFSIIACIGVFYQIPYYKALQYADTSIVVSLFSIGRIFVPILAYFIVSERLSAHQYIGFAIIVICSLFASASNIKKLKFNKALFYMVPVAIVISLQAVLQKYGLGLVSLRTFIFWNFVIITPFYLLLLINKSTRAEVKDFLFIKPGKSSYMLYLQNLASWISEALNFLVLSFLPVTIVQSIGSFQALFVNIISSRFSKSLRVDNKEKIQFSKIFLFIFIGIGIMLTL